MLFKGPLNQSKDAPSADQGYLQYSSVHRTLPRAGLHTEPADSQSSTDLQCFLCSRSHGPCLAPGNIQQVTQHDLATKRVASSFQASLPLISKPLKPSLISLSYQLLSWATNIPDRLNKFYFAAGQKQLSTENWVLASGNSQRKTGKETISSVYQQHHHNLVIQTELLTSGKVKKRSTTTHLFFWIKSQGTAKFTLAKSQKVQQ